MRDRVRVPRDGNHPREGVRYCFLPIDDPSAATCWPKIMENKTILKNLYGKYLGIRTCLSFFFERGYSLPNEYFDSIKG